MAGSSELVLVGVRQHRQEARTLDGGRELALEERARAGQARRRDLAVLADEVAQRVDVLVVDLGHAGDREAAETLATEQQRLLVALGLAVLRKLTFTTWRGHISPLSICPDQCLCRRQSSSVTWKTTPRPLRWGPRKPAKPW